MNTSAIVQKLWNYCNVLRKEYIKTLFARPQRVYLEWIKPYKGLKTAHVSSRDGRDHLLIKEAGVLGIFGVFDWSNDSVPMV